MYTYFIKHLRLTGYHSKETLNRLSNETVNLWFNETLNRLFNETRNLLLK